jgi:hypothetical protein
MHTRRLSPGCRRWPRFLTRSGFLCAALALLSAGCQNDSIETHHVPKPPDKVRLLAAMVVYRDFAQVWFFKLQGPLDKVAAQEKNFDEFMNAVTFTRSSNDLVKWSKLPKGWTEEDGSTVRKKTLRIGNKDDDLVVTVNVLPEMKGFESMNLNRWRNQIGLPTVPASEAFDDVKDARFAGIPGFLAYRVDLKGPGNPFPKQASGMQLPSDNGPGVNYTLPSDWSVSRDLPPFAVMAFTAGREKDAPVVSISPLENKGDKDEFLFENVNRWREQVGLKPLNNPADLESPTTIAVGNEQAKYYTFEGTPKANPHEAKPKELPKQRTLVAGLERGDTWWFIKMKGPETAITNQKATFEQFLKSMKLD